MILTNIALIALGITFTISSISKILNPQGFFNSLSGMLNLHSMQKKLIYPLIVFGEMSVPVLIASKFQTLAMSLSLTLLLVFTIALITVYKKNLTISCNCFGNTDQKISKSDIFRNAILLCLTILGFGVKMSVEVYSVVNIYLALSSLLLALGIVNLSYINKTLNVSSE